MTHLKSVILALVGLFLLAGTPSLSQTLDDQYSELATRIPEFGGMHLSMDGESLIVFFTAEHEGIVDQFKEALRDVFGDAYLVGMPLDSILVEEADFGWQQLREWQTLFGTYQDSLEGPVRTDIDDRSNRLSISMEDASSQTPSVKAYLSRLRIPENAVVLREGTRTIPQGTPDSNSLLWTALGIVGGVAFIFAFVKLRRSGWAATALKEGPSR